MVRLRVKKSKLDLYFQDVKNKRFQKAIKLYWKQTSNGLVYAQSVCWLFCWAKAGPKTTRGKAVIAFNAIFENLTFQKFDELISLEMARTVRYRKENIEDDFDKLLSDNNLPTQNFEVNNALRHNFKNLVHKEYRNEKESLKVVFHDAYEFLEWIESKEEEGFYISTSKNLHFYYKNIFLFYLKIEFRNIILSSNYNVKIKKNTQDKAIEFFKLLIQNLEQHNLKNTIQLRIRDDKYDLAISCSNQANECFDIIKQTINDFSQDANSSYIKEYMPDIMADTLANYSNIDYEKLKEGAKIFELLSRYERNWKARQKCIEHYGFKCSVCGFDFEKAYGQHGKGYIQVHHIKPISEIKQEYQVDPIKDLIPICPNCHAMIHRGEDVLTLDELKNMMNIK